jgi:hypothetical protein
MNKRRLSTTLLAAIALGAIALAALSTSATAGGKRGEDLYIDFRMPSNNIFCAYVSSTTPKYKYLRCDIMSGIKPAPKGPACTEGDRGVSVSMGVTGRASFPCASDTVYNKSAHKLKYGKTWRRGGFTCKSRKIGLRCRNKRGHGFFLSRQHSYRF